MKFVAIGSLALRQILPDLRPRDIDLIAHPDMEEEFDERFKVKKRYEDLKTTYEGGLEVEWARYNSSAELILQSEPSATAKTTRLGYVPLARPGILKAVMRAHLCFPIQWSKHIERYLKLGDIELDNQAEVVFQLRQAETADRFGYKPERYRAPNDRFFKDSVNRDVPHDQLHEYFKFGDEPAYKSIKFDQYSAAVEIDLFNKLDHEDKLKVIWEECLVLGWERTLSKRITKFESVAKRFLYGQATNYLPLEFRAFVLDNYQELLDNFPYDSWESAMLYGVSK